MVAQVVSNVVVFRAKDIIPSPDPTSIQTTQNKKLATFNNGRVQVIRVGYNNETLEIRAVWNVISKEQKDKLIEDIKASNIMNLPLFWIVPDFVEENVTKNLWEVTSRTTSNVRSLTSQTLSVSLFSVGNLRPIPAELQAVL